MHETFDHTADLGLRIRTSDLDSLFAEAAEALFEVLVDDLTSVHPVTRHEFRLQADDLRFLLFDWLSELLYRFDGEHWLFRQFAVQVNGPCLVGEARGERLDRDRHVLGHEVKAITYHGLVVEREANGWLAEVVIDI
jgi:SHS2 domain-containing protein